LGTNYSFNLPNQNLMSQKSLKLLAIGLAVFVACYVNNSRYRTVRDVAYAMELVSQSYVTEVSQAELKEAAIQGVLESLDPYSSYISAESLGRFNSVFEQRFAGLGVQVEGPPDRPAVTVIAMGSMFGAWKHRQFPRKSLVPSAHKSA
jgi:carboxyl-terminal processing protease